MAEHRWSGWPGAWCLDCGCEDPQEIALADGDYEEVCDENGTILKFKFNIDPTKYECPEPGSNKHNPYMKGEKNDRQADV